MGPGRGGGGSHKKLFPGGDSLLGDGDLEMDLPPEYDNIGVPNLGDDSPGYSSSDIDDRTNGNGRYSYHNKNKSQAHSTYMEKEKSFGVVKNKKAGTGPKKTKVVKKEKVRIMDFLLHQNESQFINGSFDFFAYRVQELQRTHCGQRINAST